MHKLFTMAALAATVAGVAGAQTRPVMPRFQTFGNNDEPNAPRIGVYLGENGVRDTLGVLVNSVVDDGPAARAGLREGDRIQSINGVNLRVAREDIDDRALEGAMGRRLTRELDKLRAGDDVELRVWSGGSSKTVRIKTVSSRDLDNATASAAPRAGAGANSESRASTLPRRGQSYNTDDRASIGLSLGGSITKRDTLGVFVMRVTPDGPAEKAGIVEGDRIARINGVDLRVASDDAGDAEMSRARMRRFSQEVDKLAAGDQATLTVVSGGRTHDVRVNAVKSGDLHDNNMSFYFGGEGAMSIPSIEMPNLEFLRSMPGTRMLRIPDLKELRERGDMDRTDRKDLKELENLKGLKDLKDLKDLKELKRGDDGVYIYRNGDVTRGEVDAHVREQVERAMEQVQKSLNNIKINGNDGTYYRGNRSGMSNDEIRETVERAMEKANKAIEKARVEARIRTSR